MVVFDRGMVTSVGEVWGCCLFWLENVYAPWCYSKALVKEWWSSYYLLYVLIIGLRVIFDGMGVLREGRRENKEEGGMR